ncbi:acyl-CoA dehydrogenase family protein [Alkalilimnicola ehrlichii]|uniref:acyl-CoA dehydrogenase family protein n=1 Tax=Alkalilimnicola ehrlichii TaxID=351052 RepID=UPI001C6DF433|nr:acyl-CoA dehydrogenase family protein [Alkalilimnicola ehrlichii]
MLMTMKALTEAARGLAYTGCTAVDLAKAEGLDADARAQHQRRADLMTPLVKGWCTEIAQEVTSLAVQCHGGMGFVEETGVAQYFRDARILPIYEGTNGIQAMDLVGRKTLRDGGCGMRELIADMKSTCDSLESVTAISRERRARLVQAIAFVEEATRTVLEKGRDPEFSGGIAFNFLMLTATAAAGWLLFKAAAGAAEQLSDPKANHAFLQGKVIAAEFLPIIYCRAVPRIRRRYRQAANR